jgi:hypothetical protein
MSLMNETLLNLLSYEVFESDVIPRELQLIMAVD